MADESNVTLKSLNCPPICSNETTYPGHMLIRFLCDSDITFSRGLHKNLVTVLYFSIINVLCGAGGDASFAPQANLVLFVLKSCGNSSFTNFAFMRNPHVCKH